jgi:hypothetical protein
MTVGQIISLRDPCVERRADPGTDAIPAWNLTEEQAINTLVFRHGREDLVLRPEPTFEHDATDCKLKSPAPVSGTKVTLAPDKLARRISLRNCDFSPGTGKRRDRVLSLQAVGPIQPRNAVGLFRLANFCLGLGLNLDTILHIGILSTGRHARGHCLDFSGAMGPNGEPFLHVIPEWGNKHAPFVNAQGDITAPSPGTTNVNGYPQGQQFTKLPYRLENLPQQNPDELDVDLRSVDELRANIARIKGIDPATLAKKSAAEIRAQAEQIRKETADPRATRFFREVYAFFCREYTRSINQPHGDATLAANAVPAGPGAESTATIHPDYPKANSPGNVDGREAHFNHIHAEMPEGTP